MVKKILAINCGSTSTKLAYYENDKQIIKSEITVPAKVFKSLLKVLEQLDYRTKQVQDFIEKNNINIEELDIVVARAGTIPPVPYTGAYEVNKLMLTILQYAPEAQHASTLSCMIGKKIGDPYGIPVIVYDPSCVDQADHVAKITGLPEVVNNPLCHMLNARKSAMDYAKSINRKYEDLDLIVVHLGGGITLGYHHKGRVIDWIYDDEGPMAPQRAGRIPTRLLTDLCYSGKFTHQEMRIKLAGQGGLVSYFGVQDAREIEKMIEQGNEKAKDVYYAMAYGVAKGIGELSVIRSGKIDQIILTGGLSHSKMFTDWIVEKVSFIAPVSIFAGEKEMEALAEGGLRVLLGLEEVHPFIYYPKGYNSIEEIIANPNVLA